MAQVCGQSLPCKQVRRDRVPGKRIQEQNIEALRRLALQRKARVTENDPTLAGLSLRYVKSDHASRTTAGFSS